VKNGGYFSTRRSVVDNLQKLTLKLLKLYVEATLQQGWKRRNAYRIVEDSNIGGSFSHLFTSSGKKFATQKVERMSFSVPR
jgi:hypothetical protein